MKRLFARPVAVCVGWAPIRCSNGAVAGAHTASRKTVNAIAAARGAPGSANAANGSTHSTYHGIAQPRETISAASTHAVATSQRRVRHVQQVNATVTSTTV